MQEIILNEEDHLVLKKREYGGDGYGWGYGWGDGAAPTEYVRLKTCKK